MENHPPNADRDEDAKPSRRGRLMSKLFKDRDRKPTADESNKNVDDFLRSQTDTLEVAHASPSAAAAAAPPKLALAKLDTSAATRYPQAHLIASQPQNLALRPQSRSPGRSQRANKKALLVRFVDTWPEVIGEGGDECEIPVMEVGRARKAKNNVNNVPHQPAPKRKPVGDGQSSHPPTNQGLEDPFMPGRLQRMQTGYSPAPPEGEPESEPEQKTVLPGRAASTRFLDSSRTKDENRRSFIDIHQAEMREAEGAAFANAARSGSVSASHQWDEKPSGQIFDSPSSVRDRPRTPEGSRLQRPQVEQSPSSIYSTSSVGQQISRQTSVNSQAGSVGLELGASQGSLRMRDVVSAAGDEALDLFVTRTRHLFELFRLHAETVRPISVCEVDDIARATLWWFLKGRAALELAVRDRPASPQGQMQNELEKQQAYADLAKGYWLSEEAIPEIMAGRQLQPDPEIEDVRQALVANLRKLAVSMKRNGFLPPEELFLPQQIDKSIWVDYPRLSQDMVALLTASGGSAITPSQRQNLPLSILESMPLGDTPDSFTYGRVDVDVYLMEQGVEQERFYFPCVLSMTRPQKQPNLVFIVSSQNGEVQLRIQGNKNFGPTWEDVRWRPETNTLDIRLPRGFQLVVQCSQQDFRMLSSMHEFGAKVQATLYPRQDEQVVFRSTLRGFQYFDSDPQSRLFPKEPIAQCDIAMFERIQKESAAAGPRNYHRGFRIAVITGPRTRTLSGVNHAFMPQQPIQFGFLRGEKGDPALLLKFENGRQKGSMVMSFNDEKERFRFHSLLLGTALHHDETVVADLPLIQCTITQSLSNLDGIPCLKKQAWNVVRVINDEHGGDDHPPTVLSDKLRLVAEFKNGSVTDRINVAPGELRIRLEITDARCLLLLRQPQQDITVAVSEAQVPKELPRELTDALQTLSQAQTIRMFKFNNLEHLHAFQEALTGFKVLFDGLAATFAIARRRMVVPIHKKWEAGWTRIQVVQQEKAAPQLLAFFSDFSHGRSMSFPLKGTDVYETLSRGGKTGVRIVDAKFPLPQVPADEGDSWSDDMAFVCLDLPEMPGEHDDISILFEKEQERDQLCKCLPAPVKGGSRLSRMK